MDFATGQIHSQVKAKYFVAIKSKKSFKSFLVSFKILALKPINHCQKNVATNESS